MTDFTSPPNVYWTGALERLEKRRKTFSNRDPTEQVWKELERLNKLEELVRFCLESHARPPEREPGEDTP